VVRVVAGSIAKMLLKDVKINAFVSSVGEIIYEYENTEINYDNIESSIVRCPDNKKSDEMIELIKSVKKNGDTVGGVISCVISGVPVGLGEPVFDKLHAELGKAMLSINAVKGFEFGSGFKGSKMRGSDHNDSFNADGTTKTNRSGGIQGGISNGMDIYFNVAFKPVSTIMRDQDSIDSEGNEVKVTGKGRHDPCVVPRAVPIVEAMSALVLADYLLLNRVSKI
jgi:chorismate synthase